LFSKASAASAALPQKKTPPEMNNMGAPPTVKTIGLIAGNGSFPILLAQEAKRRGDKIIAVALKEEADPSIEKHADEMTWLSIGQLGKIIAFLKDRGVTHAVMAGQVKHTQLFKNIIPDLRAAKLLTQMINKKAESVLSAVIQEFESEGIHFLPSTTYLEHWLCGPGRLTKRPLTASEEADIAFGVPLARAIAGQDIGQTIVVKDKTVIAVEAMEGTDACIRRAGEIAGPGCVVIKVARPRQDLRFDIPVVGSRTLESLAQAGAKVLALEAGKTLLLDKDTLFKEANAAQLTITSVPV
jgi:UDP-2,3-diacylglucosamine hydrolase